MDMTNDTHLIEASPKQKNDDNIDLLSDVMIIVYMKLAVNTILCHYKSLISW